MYNLGLTKNANPVHYNYKRKDSKEIIFLSDDKINTANIIDNWSIEVPSSAYNNNFGAVIQTDQSGDIVGL